MSQTEVLSFCHVLANFCRGILMVESLQAGTATPNFELYTTPNQKLSLEELRGIRVILAFYPADWSPVCADQMSLYNEILSELQKYGAELIGLSVDGV
jgi:peroxiredoxin